MLDRRISIALTLLFTLNMMDALLTIIWVRFGLAHEANPLMAVLVTDHAELFVLAKVSLVLAGSFIVWRFRRQPLAQRLLVVCILAYVFVVLLHTRMVLQLEKVPLKEIQECLDKLTY